MSAEDATKEVEEQVAAEETPEESRDSATSENDGSENPEGGDSEAVDDEEEVGDEEAEGEDEEEVEAENGVTEKNGHDKNGNERKRVSDAGDDAPALKKLKADEEEAEEDSNEAVAADA